MPPIQRNTSQSPAVAGSRWRGARTLEREVFWPLLLWSGDGSAAWTAYDRAFWETMHPERIGVWTVVNALGETRRLTCRFVDDSDHQIDADPAQRGWDLYGIHLVAEQPYWSGDPILRTWDDGGLVPFFGDDGVSGPPFNISSGNTLGSAKMPNPGPVEAFPVWTLEGPTTSVTVGTAGKTITYAAAIPDGQVRIINTSPDQLSVVDAAGTDYLAGLSDAAFAPIPPGEAVPLTLEMTGTGKVSASIVPRFYRAH